eukprot:CAMPEP_0197629692 /NCGR_PEP_ID=MMETSP1338-20131121/7445_1 /TAXON_ID=43686 ORGANISM="Pelagodinium beii, Strain RCC1491" /NCGR_SAMPLE_ID=MMETSP1338 /ASSEMBLY_ACC=CAM_ASM_000754 /LENGTH=102 /DNA_ID=CAMNT_0043200773 /DNA_START=67 /DNA_END=372 /DNA_ORIENTATION=+
MSSQQKEDTEALKQQQDAQALLAGIGTGIYNAAAFAGNTVIGTACGLAGYEQELKADGTYVDQSWGKYSGYKVGGAVNGALRGIVSGIGAAVGTCTARSEKT